MKKHIVKASVFDRKGKIISEAYNSYTKTHPVQYNYAKQCGEPYKIYLHAEIAAIIKAKGKGYRILVERYNAQGIPLLASPCPICMHAISLTSIKRVEYTV